MYRASDIGRHGDHAAGRYKPWCALGGMALIALLMLNLLIPLFFGPGLPYFDEAVYGARTLGIRDALKDAELRTFVALLTTPRLHPPLVELSAVPLSAIMDDAPLALRLTHWLWVALLCASVALLAGSIGLPPVGVVMALVFLLTSPIILSQAWSFGTDIPLASATLLTLWWLGSRPFSSLARSLLLGIAAGLGFLAKESYGLFVAVPVFLELARQFALEQRGKDRAVVVARLGAAGVVLAAICAIWYWPNLRWLVLWLPGAYRSSGSAKTFGTSTVLSPEEVLAWLVRAFWTEGLAPWVTLGALYGAVLLLRLKKQPTVRWTLFLLISSTLPAVLVWSTSTSKAVRYLLPVLAILVVFSGQGSWRLWERGLLGRFVVAGMVAASLSMALSSYWGPLLPQSPLVVAAAAWDAAGLRVIGPFSSQAMRGDWHSLDALHSIAVDVRRRGLDSAHVVVLSRFPAVSDNAYRFVVAWKHLPLEVGATSLQGWLPLAKQARDADYVVVKRGGDQGELGPVIDFPRLWGLLEEGFSHQEVARYGLPDGSDLIVYHRSARWYLGESGNAVYRLYEGIADAEMRQIPTGTKPEDVVRTLDVVKLGGREMPALFQHPPGKLVFPLTLPVRRGIEFRTSVGLVPEAMGRSDGVVFRVSLVSDGKEQVLIDAPYVASPGGQWMDYKIDISKFAGTPVDLQLETDVGPRGDSSHDWAVWGQPAIYTTDR